MRSDLHALTPGPHGGTASVVLSADDRARLRQAAGTLVEARGPVLEASEFLGNRLGQLAGSVALRAVTGAEARLSGLIERALWRGYRLATLGLDRRGGTPRARKLAVMASGALSGLVGLPGLAVDLPFTTAMILRGVAAVADAHGEDLRNPDTRRACIEVLTIGAVPDRRDGAELSYWTTRASVSHAAIDMTIRQTARLLLLPLSEKFFAQAVPIAGALAGGVLNSVFVDYFQQIAEVHFTVRRLERSIGDSAAVQNFLRQAMDEIRRPTRLP